MKTRCGLCADPVENDELDEYGYCHNCHQELVEMDPTKYGR